MKNQFVQTRKKGLRTLQSDKASITNTNNKLVLDVKIPLLAEDERETAIYLLNVMQYHYNRNFSPKILELLIYTHAMYTEITRQYVEDVMEKFSLPIITTEYRNSETTLEVGTSSEVKLTMSLSYKEVRKDEYEAVFTLRKGEEAIKGEFMYLQEKDTVFKDMSTLLRLTAIFTTDLLWRVNI